MRDGRWWIESSDRPGELGTLGLSAAGRLYVVSARDEDARRQLEAACISAASRDELHEAHTPAWPAFKPKPWHSGPPQPGHAMNVRAAVLRHLREVHSFSTMPADPNLEIAPFLWVAEPERAGSPTRL